MSAHCAKFIKLACLLLSWMTSMRAIHDMSSFCLVFVRRGTRRECALGAMNWGSPLQDSRHLRRETSPLHGSGAGDNGEGCGCTECTASVLHVADTLFLDYAHIALLTSYTYITTMNTSTWCWTGNNSSACLIG